METFNELVILGGSELKCKTSSKLGSFKGLHHLKYNFFITFLQNPATKDLNYSFKSQTWRWQTISPNFFTLFPAQSSTGLSELRLRRLICPLWNCWETRRRSGGAGCLVEEEWKGYQEAIRRSRLFGRGGVGGRSGGDQEETGGKEQVVSWRKSRRKSRRSGTGWVLPSCSWNAQEVSHLTHRHLHPYISSPPLCSACWEFCVREWLEVMGVSLDLLSEFRKFWIVFFWLFSNFLTCFFSSR